MGLDSTAAGGVEICADTYQYIDDTTMTNKCKGRGLYDTPNNDLNTHAHGQLSSSFALISSPLTTNRYNM